MLDRARKSLLLIGLCAAAGVLTGCGDTISDADIEFVGLSDVRAVVQERSGNARLIDPRSAEEFAAGRIPGAVNLPLTRVPDGKDSLDPGLARFKRLIVYGNDPGSGLARAVTKRLMRSGAKDVKMFAGGLSEWTRAGLRVERDAGAAGAGAQGDGPGEAKEPGR
jgi:rhodanese-related sulfurtransferase